jgi:acyl-CoA thioesterase
MTNPSEIIELMLSNDTFSNWLGVEIVELTKGKCILRLKVKESMLNGFNIAHGGIAYSLADSCLAFASNSNGYKSVTIDTSFSYLKKVNKYDVLTAISIEENVSKKIAVYSINILNQENDKVAFMKGTVSISDYEW